MWMIKDVTNDGLYTTFNKHNNNNIKVLKILKYIMILCIFFQKTLEQFYNKM